MNVSPFIDFVCPLDGLPLRKDGNSYRCEKRHTYDCAREGYVNFLLVQQKASLDPGDHAPMVDARRRFLQCGHYQPIAEVLFESVKKIEGNLSVLDAGCGEGYYLNFLAQSTRAEDCPRELRLVGTDISKWAVKAAAKRSRDIAWAVASNRQLPFAPESIDLILSVFGFPFWESFRTLQPTKGRVILVDPGPDHLLELRQVIYPQVNATALLPLDAALANGYRLEEELPLRFSIALKSQAEIQDLLSMTPHAHRISATGRGALARLAELKATVDVVVRTLLRT